MSFLQNNYSNNNQTHLDQQRIFYWLLTCSFLIFAMIVLGGVTRLTHSGLSMVEWNPIMGAIPPLNHQDWVTVFNKYQQSPEFKIINNSMTLQEFKTIFFFEYFHRLLGRVTGIVFILPFMYFWKKGKLTNRMVVNLTAVFILGATQGLLGWFMVKSGLVDEPRVSHYRLTAHLGLAVFLYGVIIWTAMNFYYKSGNDPAAPLKSKVVFTLALALPAIIYFMILSGALVAGLKAGWIWNTFPLMGDSLIPHAVYSTKPIWMAALSDPTTVQFNHRTLAYTIFVITAFLAFFIFRFQASVVLKKWVVILGIAVCFQIALGVSVLLLFVPTLLASVHQATAILVFTFSIILAFFAFKTHTG